MFLIASWWFAALSHITSRKIVQCESKGQIDFVFKYGLSFILPFCVVILTVICVKAFDFLTSLDFWSESKDV